MDSTGRKTALASMLAARDTIEPVKALQQSGNGGQVPFAALWRWYLSLVQLARDATDGDKARSSKFTNCWAKGLSSHVRDPLGCQPIIGPALHRFEVAQARQHPRYGGAMPPPAAGSRYPPSVQFIRESTIRNEACRHKLPNGREQSKGAGVCGPFIGQRTVHLAPAGRSFPAYWLHRAIMAAF
jgi:hypothetical protein